MQDKAQSNNIWHRITINEASFTNGKGLLALLQEAIPENLSLESVVLAGIEGSGDPQLGITQLGCSLISVKELRERLVATSQIDWATLYFLEKVDATTSERICEELSIMEAVSESRLTVRVIDDSYVEIFTPDNSLLSYLEFKFPLSTVQSGRLDDMDFPQ